VSKLHNNGIDDKPTSSTIRKCRALLLIATTPVVGYANHPMQPLTLREIFPYLSKNKKLKNRDKLCQ